VLKISPTREDDKSFKVRLCGQFTKEYVPELERLLAAEGESSQTTSIDPEISPLKTALPM
jgi:hypothetical protein